MANLCPEPATHYVHARDIDGIERGRFLCRPHALSAMVWAAMADKVELHLHTPVYIDGDAIACSWKLVVEDRLAANGGRQ